MGISNTRKYLTVKAFETSLSPKFSNITLLGNTNFMKHLPVSLSIVSQKYKNVIYNTSRNWSLLKKKSPFLSNNRPFPIKWNYRRNIKLCVPFNKKRIYIVTVYCRVRISSLLLLRVKWQNFRMEWELFNCKKYSTFS